MKYELYKNWSENNLRRNKSLVIKNNYCKKRIPLLRIPYWHFNKIVKIIDTAINKINSLTPEDLYKEIIAYNNRFLSNNNTYKKEPT